MKIIRLKYTSSKKINIYICYKKPLKYLEKIGFYNNKIDHYGNKYLFINKERFNYWLIKGLFVDIKLYNLIKNISKI